MYFSKEIYKKQALRKRRWIGLFCGVVFSFLALIPLFAFEVDLAIGLEFVITIAIVVGIVVVVIHWLAGNFLMNEKIAVIEQQERLLGFDFDLEMQKNQVEKGVSSFESSQWFISREAATLVRNSSSKDAIFYHIDFIHHIDVEPFEVNVRGRAVKYKLVQLCFITGDTHELTGPYRSKTSTTARFEDWFNENKPHSTFKIPERSAILPYAPFNLGQHTGKDALYYEVAGFKMDVFNANEYDGNSASWYLLTLAYLNLETPWLREKMALDFDDDRFWVVADVTTLEEFANGFRDMCNDEKQMGYLLSRAEEFDE